MKRIILAVSIVGLMLVYFSCKMTLPRQRWGRAVEELFYLTKTFNTYYDKCNEYDQWRLQFKIKPILDSSWTHLNLWGESLDLMTRDKMEQEYVKVRNVLVVDLMQEGITGKQVKQEMKWGI